MIRALLDSDVILDYVLQRKHHDDAESLFEAIADLKFAAYVSAIALLNVHYFAQKEIDASFAKGEGHQDAVALLGLHRRRILLRNTKDFGKSPVEVYSPAEFLATLAA